jgi:hypothetical protein
MTIEIPYAAWIWVLGIVGNAWYFLPKLAEWYRDKQAAPGERVMTELLETIGDRDTSALPPIDLLVIAGDLLSPWETNCIRTIVAAMYTVAEVHRDRRELPTIDIDFMMEKRLDGCYSVLRYLRGTFSPLKKHHPIGKWVYYDAALFNMMRSAGRYLLVAMVTSQGSPYHQEEIPSKPYLLVIFGSPTLDPCPSIVWAFPYDTGIPTDWLDRIGPSFIKEIADLP